MSSMTPLQCARQEWEATTTPHPKNHRVGKNIHIHEFRKYGQAIAFLNWDGEHIEITKLEKLPGEGGGAAIPLIEFLKTLADKHQVRLFGNAKAYVPDSPIPEGPLLSQEQLEAWYKKHGFQLRKSIPELTTVWYPEAP